MKRKPQPQPQPKTPTPQALAEQLTEKADDKKVYKMLYKGKFDPEFQDYSLWKNPIKWWQYRSVAGDIKNRLLVHMELSNGEHTHFFVNADNEHFIVINSKDIGCAYVIDHKMKYYDTTAKAYCLDYHEDFCLPLKRLIPINRIREQLEENAEDIAYATNPRNLRRFMKSDIIMKLLKGDDLDQLFRFMKLMLIVNAVMIGIVLLYLLYRFGLQKG